MKKKLKFSHFWRGRSAHKNNPISKWFFLPERAKSLDCKTPLFFENRPLFRQNTYGQRENEISGTSCIYIRAISVCLLAVCPPTPPKWLDLAKNSTSYTPSRFTSFRSWTHSFLPLRSLEATRGNFLLFLPSQAR